MVAIITPNDLLFNSLVTQILHSMNLKMLAVVVVVVVRLPFAIDCLPIHLDEHYFCFLHLLASRVE